MFSRWLFYGIGTTFSLGVLVVMASLRRKVVGAMALAFLAKYVASAFTGGGEGVKSMALQQGGLGLVMSTLIVMTPPMAAGFFKGTLANFVAQSSFGQLGRNSTGQVNDARQAITRSDGSDFSGGRRSVEQQQTGTDSRDRGGPINNPYAINASPNSAPRNSPRIKYES